MLPTGNQKNIPNRRKSLSPSKCGIERGREEPREDAADSQSPDLSSRDSFYSTGLVLFLLPLSKNASFVRHFHRDAFIVERHH